MSDTITSMELRFADLLLPNQLQEGDLIKVNNEYLTVKSTEETTDGVSAILLNDFDDEVEAFFFDDQKIEWYVFVE